MKITKLVHSCLIVEHDGKKYLVDPGAYSWQSGVVKPELLSGIDNVVVTHIHSDKQESPEANWYSTAEVAEKLKTWDIEAVSSSDDPSIKFIESSHADLHPWFPEQPQHTSFVLFNDLLIGGDCHTLTSSHGARIFGAAISGGPWGAVVGFGKMIESMTERPEIVIPLHDWHLNDEARNGFYARLPEVLSEFGVEFVPLESGVPKDI
jgi:L-ascorbate metabolism protein UlaG (beta-lactamase superfamily)